MAIAYLDAVNGHPLTIAVDAVAWAQPDAANWFTRCRELNRLLRKSTHLLCIPAADKTETTWYAGVAGTSLAAGIERMAISEEVLRHSIVAFPLDTRIYVANVQKGLVREEWVLYPDAFETRVQTWRAERREFVILTGGGRLEIDLPYVSQLPVDIDSKAMSFRHASVALLTGGMVRWRDCISALLAVVMALGASFSFSWWQSTPNIDPLQKVAALVTQPVAPAYYNASAELAKLALVAAEHDVALWKVEEATDLSYKATDGVIELHFASGSPIRTPIAPLPIAPNVATLKPYTLSTFKEKLEEHLASAVWSLTFGDPYPIGAAAELEQHVSVMIGDVSSVGETSIAAALVDLSERLVGLPIMLYEANCTVTQGDVNACELRLAIRGLSS